MFVASCIAVGFNILTIAVIFWLGRKMDRMVERAFERAAKDTD